jgi:hypothetical protein
MKELACTKCGKKYWGTRKGKCPKCFVEKKPSQKSSHKTAKTAWKVLKKVYKHMNDIKPLEPRKRRKHVAKKPVTKKR